MLPRVLSLVKDADDGPDALLIPELERRLATTCQEYFGGRVRVDSVETGKSNQSVFLQLADLFFGERRPGAQQGGGGSNQPEGRVRDLL